MAQQQQPAPPPPVMTSLRNFDEDNKQHLFIQTQNQKINEKMLDNQKLLLESLTNLPQNLLQSWIQSGQLQVSVDEGKRMTHVIKNLKHFKLNFMLTFKCFYLSFCRRHAINSNPIRNTKGKFDPGNHNKENSDQTSNRKNQNRSRMKILSSSDQNFFNVAFRLRLIYLN